MSKKAILVTGGAGFIGSNIVEALVALKKRVIVLDNFSSGFKKHLAPFEKDIEVVRGDIRNIKTVDRVMKRVDKVVHQAAIRSVPKSVDNPLYSHEVNTTGSMVLLNSAVKHKVKRFVYASSSAAYGNVVKFPQKETDTLLPQSPYGASKLCAENYCYCYYDNHGLETVSLRYFNVYGPRQNPESLYSAVVPAFIHELRHGKIPVIDGTGRQSRDFIHVKDVAQANVRALFGGRQVVGKAFNVASGTDLSILTLLKLIAKHMGIKPKFKRGPKRRGDAMKTYADIKYAKKFLKWSPKISIDKGLKETIEWFEKANPKQF